MSEIETPECVQVGGFGPQECGGPVEYRYPLSGTGVAHPRCVKHWEHRLEVEQQLWARYPLSPPADWSPLDCGEAWAEEDY